MKEAWYKYVVEHKEYWGNGWTLKRLEKVKEHVLSDKEIMWDLMTRHGANTMTPEVMKEKERATFDHGIGNFVGSIHFKMMDLKIIKG